MHECKEALDLVVCLEDSTVTALSFAKTGAKLLLSKAKTQMGGGQSQKKACNKRFRPLKIKPQYMRV